MPHSIVRRKFHRINRRSQTQIANITAIAVLIIISVCAFLYSTDKSIKVKEKDAAAMRVPYSSAVMLKSLSEHYGLPFYEVLAVYAVDNRFLAARLADYDETEMTEKYIISFDALKKQYKEKKLEPYITLFKILFEEIKYFPIPDPNGFYLYMYGDSYEEARGGSRSGHLGTDIIHRENVVGQLPVAAMSSGVIERFGFDTYDGNYIGIRTFYGNYYYYAHLDSFSGIVELNNHVAAGEILGYMGDSGKKESKSEFPVRLHIGIKVNTKLSKNEFWVNPYIFLRLAEEPVV